MAAGLDSAWTSTIPVPIPFEKAIKVEMQGQMHPARYLQGLAGAYEKLGGVLLQDCRVTSVTQDGVQHAETSLGEIRAEKIVYATHVPPGITLFSFRCAPYRSYAMAFTLKDQEGYPDALVYDSRDPYHYFRSHVINGKKHMIAGGNDHKTGHNANTAYIFTELEAYVRRYFDIDEVAAKWSSQYYESADGLPYIGLMPGYNDIYVATGFGGNGMIWGSLSGKILCDMIVGNTSLYHDLFSPSRIKPIAGFASFVKENADVIGQFIGRRFAYEHISQLAELAPGQAKIAELEGRKIALYKDERGVLHALDPVCPHAGCIVTWNSAERSWDCPCHGARYSPDGDLLTGPARHNLATVEWSNL